MAKGSRTTNESAVSQEWRTLLVRALSPLDTGRSGLAADASNYVLTGASAAVLADLAGGKAPYSFFEMWGTDPRPPIVLALFTGLGAVPPEVGYRLGEVLAAVAAGTTGRLNLAVPVRWVEALLVAFGDVALSGHRSEQQKLDLDIAVVEAMSMSAGLRAVEPLREGFRPPAVTGHSYYVRYHVALRALTGYASAVSRHAQELQPLVAVTKVDDRLHVLDMLAGLPAEVLSSFAGELVSYATSTSSLVRNASLPLLQSCGGAASRPLRQLALEGAPDARLRAFQQLMALDGDDIEWARAHAGEDRAPKVRALLDAPARSSGEPIPAPIVELPQIDWSVPESARTVLQEVVDEANAAIDVANRPETLAAEEFPPEYRSIKRIPAVWVDQLMQILNTGKPPVSPVQAGPADRLHFVDTPLLRRLRETQLGASGLALVLHDVGWLVAHNESLSGQAQSGFTQLHEANGLTLLEVSTILDQLGYDGGAAVLRSYIAPWNSFGRDWADEAVAPFMTYYLEQVLDLLIPGREPDWTDPLAPFAALSTLPVLPSQAVEALYTVATGTRKALRLPAQDVLAKVSNIESLISASLTDGKSEVRTIAAQWLGRLGKPAAVEPLEKAVKVEKNDQTLGAMLDALQALGQPIERYLDRDSLLKQAEKAVAKGLPKNLAWFPWSALPEVRWVGGEAVAPAILKWMLIQAVRAKTAEPNAVLRKYSALFDPRDREALGQFVLETWMAEDLRPIDPETARERAEDAAQWDYRAHQQWPAHYVDDPLRNASISELTAYHLPLYLRLPAGSAASSKGVLAVAAACAGERAARVAQRYLKEWYGMRPHQGRALIVMLAWIEHPSATQLMLSVGSRFRTKSFQVEAATQAELLAERKGWSVGELADRTIPVAGLDEEGILELPYGPRTFTAHLMPDLTLQLRSPDDAVVKALPAARASDDADVAKASKAALTAAKRELKTIVTLQAERLYESLCTERTWRFEDWQRYLNAHPVMRHLTQRLAWTATTDDGLVVFRPLDDGTLTDVADELVKLPDDAVVAVAHDSLLEPAVVAPWQQHFADYEVEPLFQQFGKGTFSLPEGQRKDTELSEFEGHLVEGFALRARATKLGYTRGAALDGGWFINYEKRFPTLGITAKIGFSGNELPEVNRTVALAGLSFVPQNAGDFATPLRLSEIPVVLLSEAWNDMRVIAAEGTGFDPDWQQKVDG